MDFKLELVVLPVSDVDRAKQFYTEKAGFNLDVDHRASDKFRVVQMTPPGGTHLVVTDIVAARAELVGRGMEVSDVRHLVEGEWKPGPHPDHTDYNSFADFSDPDGNTWVIQERGYGAKV